MSLALWRPAQSSQERLATLLNLPAPPQAQPPPPVIPAAYVFAPAEVDLPPFDEPVSADSARIVLDAALQPTGPKLTPSMGERPAQRTEYDGFASHQGMHGLVLAAHRAFAEHLTLRLTPDDIWTVITQGIGQHINMGDNAERLRSKFVAHERKETIKIRRDEFIRGETTRDEWMGAVAELTNGVRALDNGRSNLMKNAVQKFSTTQPLHTFCYNAALLSGMQAYCEYRVETLCGIPVVELVGTVADWQQLLDATLALDLAGLDEQLRPWNDRLVPVIRSLVAARIRAETGATSASDVEFLRSIYKYENTSGGAAITGWIAFLFPYLGSRGTTRLDQLRWHLSAPRSRHEERYLGRVAEVGSDCFPSGLTTVPFVWAYHGEELPMTVHAGFDVPVVCEEKKTVQCRHAFAIAYTE